ncbi:MAG: phospholipid carrier-dependent glycosyltransferase, partial [Chloroflexota bacterium]
MDRALGKGSRWRALGPVLPILLGFAAVNLAFNLTVPLLEAPDETSHVAVLRFIEARHTLPVQQPPANFPAGQEGSQPPLYYLIGATLYHLSPAPALAPTFSRQNPFVSFQRSTADAANRNFYGHSLAERFPYRGDVLGLHLARLAGLLLGGLTVLFTYLIAREIWPGAGLVAILGAGLVAFNPELAFISGVVNNDSAIAMGATLVLWCLVRWIMRGGSTRLAVGLGVALASALLAKTDGILLLPLVAVVLGFPHPLPPLPAAGEGSRQGDPLETLPPRLKAPPGEGGEGGRREGVGDEGNHRSPMKMRMSVPRSSPRHALIVAVLTALLAGWWFVRNQLLYGDPLGYRAMLAANAAMIRHAPLDPIAALLALVKARGTFWGIFGWTNVLYPARVYQVLDGFTLLCAIGLAIGAWQSRGLVVAAFGRLAAFRTTEDGRRILAILLLGSWSLLVFASLVRWVQINEAADQWRLFFGALAPVAIFLALGLDRIRLAVLGLVGRCRPPRQDVASPPAPLHFQW